MLTRWEELMDSDLKYIPALKFSLLTPLFDPFQRWVMRELTFKRRLIAEAHIGAGQHVLDLGCGAATFCGPEVNCSLWI